MGGNAFTQSDLDKSINELRDRQLTKWGDTEAKTMPKVQLNGGNLSVNGVVINDPARDPDVNPVLWEIRRIRKYLQKMIPARECSICSTRRIRVMRILKKGIFIIFVKRNFVYSRLVN